MARRYYPLFLVLGILLLVGWQLNIARSSEKLDSSYTRKDATGLMINAARPFTYFYYYLNLYPLWTRHEPLVYSREGAQKIIAEHPETLRMERSYYVQWGEHAQTLLLLVDAFLKGRPVDVSIKPFSTIFFITALALLLVSFFLIGRPLLGIILVLLLGSNPFQLYEVYANENIFGLSISLLLFILAVNLPLLANLDLPRYFLPLASIFSGAVFGTITHIRTEMLPLLAVPILAYAFYLKKPLKKRILILGLLLASSFLTAKGWECYFDHKFKETYALVKEVRGDFSFSLKAYYHTFWHAVFTGLGDFDQKYGYAWGDEAAYRYAAPILTARYPQKFNDLSQAASWPVELEYQEVIREKVLTDIITDPGWYLTTLSQRVARLLTRLTPLELNLNGTSKFSFPIHGVIFIPIFLFYLYTRDWLAVKLLLCSLPLSAMIVLIYSGRNITSVSVYHLFALALFLESLVSQTSAKLWGRTPR